MSNGKFKEICVNSLNENFFKLIGEKWMLITAGNEENLNMMTASWGGVGVLWNKNVETIYLRPTRYTKEIIDSTDTFSLSVLPQKYKTALDYCGSHSGRDEDKFQKTKLDVEYMNGTPWIKQARIVIFCNKLYAQEFDPNCFVEEKLCKQNYRKDDFHTMYIGEITKIMVESRDVK